MADIGKNKTLFSIVVPVYGNESNIPETIPYMVDRLCLFPDYDVEIIMVCDGSPDNSYIEMRKMRDRYPNTVRIARLVRNFGQGAAISCGVSLAKGDVIGVISCDLQDPFELFVDMLEAWSEGDYKLVIASREERGDKGLGKIASIVFNRLVHTFISTRYPIGGFDFFLMDKSVAEEFCRIDAPNGSMQMLLVWLGYEYKEIPYERKERKIGKSGYKLGRKLEIASGLFVTYTPIVSRIWGGVGLAFMLLSLVVFFVAMCLLLFGNSNMSLWFISSLILLASGLVLCSVACVGEYVWRCFYQSLNRPRYIIDEAE